MNISDTNKFFESYDFTSFDDNWNLSKIVSSIIDDSKGRRVIIHILDNWHIVNPYSKLIWLDLIERAGFYPYYVDKLRGVNMETASLQSKIRTSFFKSEYLSNVYFHAQQKEIEQALTAKKNIAVSAPTSFGKSLLIEEIVARKTFNNILIIQPTLALIDETRRKMKKYSDYYNLVVNTRQEIKDNNIFILTAERVLEISDFPNIDFFVIDEFYKVSNRRNDSRIDALNIALLRVMSTKPQALFLTPTVDSISEEFRKKYSVNFFKTDYSLVNTNVIEVRNKRGNVLQGDKRKEQLFELLWNQEGQSIVYVKSPQEAYKLANQYLDWLGPKANDMNNLDIFEWMDRNISPNWQLRRLLQHGIGAHNGALPRHIVSSEIDLFNKGNLKVLFATVSLIEGVNTVAKNMIIYNRQKGKIPIDFFDFANIRGRAGRMGHHFTGNVYVFDQEPEIEEFIIDIPCVDQNQVSDEILINIENKDVVESERKENLIADISEDFLKIVQKNMVSVSGQKKLYRYINIHYNSLDYLKWQTNPNYEQLWKTLYLGYSFLNISDNKKLVQKKAVTALKLAYSPLSKVILEQEEYFRGKNKVDPLNSAIDDILRFQRTDANFQIPKILAVVESIQRYVFESHGISNYGDYTFFASLLENEQIDERFHFLIDYGVPSSAIKKISIYVPEEVYGDKQILSYIKKHFKKLSSQLISYERNLVLQAIK